MLRPVEDLLDLRLSELLELVAAPEPAPGAGSVLALSAALAAAVLAMAARASRDDWPEAAGIAAQAESLRARAAPLAARDAEAYQAALSAREAAAGLDPDHRDWEIGRAFARAAEAPLELVRISSDVAELSRQVAVRAAGQLRPDALAAASLAAACARGAAELVAVNLTLSENDPRVEEARVLAEAAVRAAASAFES
jgi:formiminotetrahydrofolate cyclodeaminase